MSAISKTIGIGVALILIATLLPTALLEIAAADVTGWNATVKTVFQTLLPILAVISLVYMFLTGVSRRGSMNAGRIVQIVVALFIVATIIPLSISQIQNMQTSTVVGTATYTLSQPVVLLTKTLMPILAIIAVALAFFTLRARR